MTKWEVGDKLRILDAKEIFGVGIKNDGVYTVNYVHDDGTPEIDVPGEPSLCFFKPEMRYVERVTDVDEEDTERNAELGEPSCGCDCGTLSEIREELIDIKAMIGRLIRNGGEAE